jgi:hypothetical protein
MMNHPGYCKIMSAMSAAYENAVYEQREQSPNWNELGPEMLKAVKAVDKRFDDYKEAGHGVDAGLHLWLKELIQRAEGG